MSAQILSFRFFELHNLLHPPSCEGLLCMTGKFKCHTVLLSVLEAFRLVRADISNNLYQSFYLN